MKYRAVFALSAFCLFRTSAWALLFPAPFQLYNVTKYSDFIAEVDILATNEPSVQPDACDKWVIDTLRDPITTSQASRDLAACRFNGFWQTTKARVITPLKGCRTNDIIDVDYNNAAADAVMFWKGQKCIVFLRRFKDGHCGVLSDLIVMAKGKYMIKDEMVLDWRYDAHPRDSQEFRYKLLARPTPLVDVLAQIREAVAANARDEQLDISLTGPIHGGSELFSLAITNRGPASVDIFGTLTDEPAIDVTPPDGGTRSFLRWGAIDSDKAVLLRPYSNLVCTVNMSQIFKSLPPSQYTIRVRINGRQSQPVVVINKADPQNSPNPGDGRNAMAGENAIRPGNDIGEAVKAMAESGYKETGLDLLATKVDTDLRMWAVGEGVLILAYSNKNKKVHGMSYYLCDERPKATRKTFDLIVKEFDPKTRELKITLPNHPAGTAP